MLETHPHPAARAAHLDLSLGTPRGERQNQLRPLVQGMRTQCSGQLVQASQAERCEHTLLTVGRQAVRDCMVRKHLGKVHCMPHSPRCQAEPTGHKHHCGPTPAHEQTLVGCWLGKARAVLEASAHSNDWVADWGLVTQISPLQSKPEDMRCSKGDWQCETLDN